MRPPLTKISVVIPVLNGAAELDLQLRAVLEQAASLPYEVLVGDNGSTDGTWGVIERWAQADPRVRGVEASARSGPAAARNLAVERATGDVLAFCDADDLVAPGWLAALVAALQDADIVGGAFDFSTLNGVASTDPAQHYTAQFGFYPGALGANMAVRTTVFRQVGGFDETMHAGEDLDLSWRLQLAGHRLVLAPDAVVAKRERTDSQGRRRQQFAYGRHDAGLYRRFRKDGMRRITPLTVKTYGWLVVNAPVALVQQDRRRQWERAFFLRLGRLRGSIDQRVFFP